MWATVKVPGVFWRLRNKVEDTREFCLWSGQWSLENLGQQTSLLFQPYMRFYFCNYQPRYSDHAYSGNIRFGGCAEISNRTHPSRRKQIHAHIYQIFVSSDILTLSRRISFVFGVAMFCFWLKTQSSRHAGLHTSQLGRAHCHEVLHWHFQVQIGQTCFTICLHSLQIYLCTNKYVHSNPAQHLTNFAPAASQWYQW